MSEENKNPKKNIEKSTNFEKGVKTELNEHKLPDFQHTPTPPPPKEKTEGGNKNEGEKK